LSKFERLVPLIHKYLSPKSLKSPHKMSLMTQQTLMMAKSDRDDALRRLSIGDDTQKVRDLLAGATKRIAKLEKQLVDEKAKAESDRKAAQEQASAKDKGKKAAGSDRYQQRPERPALPEDFDLACVDCGGSFPFTGKDQVFFQKQGWAEPSRCSHCRTAKKSVKPSGKELTCGGCKVVFLFSDGKARVFEEKGWAEPKRCRDCLHAKHEKKDASKA
jgi:hypothetical protein